jgi:hypothetical protein
MKGKFLGFALGLALVVFMATYAFAHTPPGGFYGDLRLCPYPAVFLL